MVRSKLIPNIFSVFQAALEKRKKMDCKQAKSIDIVAFLSDLGLKGESRGVCVWYCSPYRVETKASFRVDTTTNRFKDFATGLAGDILDLVKLIYKTDTPGALNILEKSGKVDSFSFSKAIIKPADRKPSLIIKHVKPITNQALKQYLVERKIPLSIATRYLQEAYYSVNEKQYFSLAFKNDKGGYELRNRFMKSCASPKYHTTFNIPGSKQLNLFEGFFNFLSALAYFRVSMPANNTIVLNSLSGMQTILPMINRYEKINLYLDNDIPGRDAADKIKSLHPYIEDKAKIIYPIHNDFNELLINIKC